MGWYLLRVELPDRPGALGAVASRIGAVRADVVAVDVVGRADGRAVDEFVVELAEEHHVSLLLNEVAEVDGVKVEELRALPAEVGDRRLDAYDTAAAFLGADRPAAVLSTLTERVCHDLGAHWSAVLDAGRCDQLAAMGDPPAPAWLSAYVDGTRSEHPERIRRGTAELVWAPIEQMRLVVAAGRPTWPFGNDDQLRLAAIARLAGLRWAELLMRSLQSPAHDDFEHASAD